MTRTMGTWLLAAGLAWAGPLALECASDGPAEAGHYMQRLLSAWATADAPRDVVSAVRRTSRPPLPRLAGLAPEVRLAGVDASH